MLAAIASLGVVQSVQGSVVSRNIDITLNAANSDSYSLDLDQNGTTDFTFETAYVPDPVLTVGFDQIRSLFGSDNGVVIDMQTGDSFPPASRLALGDTISSANLFSNSGDDNDLFFDDTLDPTTGNFEGQIGYVGLQFDGAGGIHYGYAQVSVKSLSDSSPLDLTIGTIAYDDVAGNAIHAGDVPEPASIALLAMTGLSVLSSRRGRR